MFLDIVFHDLVIITIKRSNICSFGSWSVKTWMLSLSSRRICKRPQSVNSWIKYTTHIQSAEVTVTLSVIYCFKFKTATASEFINLDFGARTGFLAALGSSYNQWKWLKAQFAGIKICFLSLGSSWKRNGSFFIFDSLPCFHVFTHLSSSEESGLSVREAGASWWSLNCAAAARGSHTLTHTRSGVWFHMQSAVMRCLHICSRLPARVKRASSMLVFSTPTL